MSYLFDDLAESGGGIDVLEAQRGIVALFDTTMILLDRVSYAADSVMLDLLSQDLGNGAGIGCMATAKAVSQNKLDVFYVCGFIV